MTLYCILMVAEEKNKQRNKNFCNTVYTFVTRCRVYISLPYLVVNCLITHEIIIFI